MGFFMRRYILCLVASMALYRLDLCYACLSQLHSQQAYSIFWSDVWRYLFSLEALPMALTTLGLFLYAAVGFLERFVRWMRGSLNADADATKDVRPKKRKKQTTEYLTQGRGLLRAASDIFVLRELSVAHIR